MKRLSFLSAGAVCLLFVLALPSLLVAQEEEVALQVEEVWTAPLPPGLRPADLSVSPDASRIALRVRRGGAVRMVVNGAEGPHFDRIEGFRFTGGGEGFAYVGFDGEKGATVVLEHAEPEVWPYVDAETLVTDRRATRSAYVVTSGPDAEAGGRVRPNVVFGSKAGVAHDEIAALVMSEDGRHLAYVARDERSWRVFRDGKPTIPFEEIPPKSLRIGPDGAHVVFAGRGGREWVVWRDGELGRTVPRMGAETLTLSPDGKRWAYWVGSRPETYFVLDGKPLTKHAEVGTPPPVFSADSAHFGYTALVEGKWYVVVDGKEYGPWSGVAGQDLVVGVGGKVAYTAERDGRWWVHAGGKEYGPYDGIAADAYAVSEDATHVAFGAEKDGAWRIVHDGKESAPQRGAAAVAVSPDGRHAAYLRITPEGQPSIAVDEHVVEGVGSLPGGLHFPSNEALNVAGMRDPRAPRLVVLRIRVP